MEKPDAHTLIKQFREVYPILIETQMLLDAPRMGNPPPESLLRVALLAEIGEMLNALKPRWAWWKRRDKTFEEGDVLGELADIMHFALGLDVRVLHSIYAEAAVGHGKHPVTLSGFTFAHAKPHIGLLLDHYADEGPARRLLDSAIGEYEACLDGLDEGPCDIVAELLYRGWFTFDTAPYMRLHSYRTYVEMIVMAGFSVERLVDAYFNKARENMGRWERDPKQVDEVLRRGAGHE